MKSPALYMGLPVVVDHVEVSQTTGSTSARIRLRFETDAERESRRKALLAEAKAWRKLSWRYAGIGLWVWGYLCMDLTEERECERITPEQHAAMRLRLNAHLQLAGYDTVQGTGNYFGDDGDESRQPRSLACLFLELECREEARSLSMRKGGGNG